MSVISVLVPGPISALLEAKIASGQYAGASEYVTHLIVRDQPLSCAPSRPGDPDPAGQRSASRMRYADIRSSISR